MAHASVDPFAGRIPTEDGDATKPSPKQSPFSPSNSSTSQAKSQSPTAAQESSAADDNSSSVGARPEDEAPVDRVREHFLNWQVMEAGEQDPFRTASKIEPDPSSTSKDPEITDPDLTIEGEAVVLSESAANAARALAGATESDPDDIDADVVDSILIAGLPERTVVVKPGSASQLVVSLLNNGSHPATFDVHVEGWVRDGWVPEGTHHVPMQPGERNALRITFAPPNDPSALAGEFPFVIVVRSTQHLRRVTRLHAKLIIRPYTDFALGKLEDRQLRRASRAQTIFTLPVTNRSNHPIAVQLSAQTVGLPTESAWLDPKTLPPLGFLHQPKGKRNKRTGDGWQPNPTVISLNTGETREVALRVMPRKAPLFGGRPIDASVRVTASVVGEVRMPRAATAELEYAPPIKPWHLALASAASLMLLVLTGMTALGATLFFGGNGSRTLGNSTAPIVIVLNQNAPTSAVQSVAQGVLPTPEREPAAPIVESAPDNPMIVTADQITNPGEPGAQSASNPPAQGQTQVSQLPVAEVPAGGAPVITNSDITAPPQGGIQRPPQQVTQAQAASGAPAAAAASPSGAALTYGEMFQEIALQYDLDWRLLAAQAYVETGLDALALGNDGDMGLMQILPNTWKEWAPTVGAVDPFDAYSNTLVAATYLDYVRGELGKRGYPQAQWMLVAYNWGPDRLINFLEDGGTFETLPAIRAQYATDIIKIARTIP